MDRHVKPHTFRARHLGPMQSAACAATWMYTRWICNRTSDSRITGQTVFSFLAHVLGKLVALTAMMDRLDRLFEPDGDEEAEDDGGDVDEELAPAAGGVMGR